MKTIDNLLEKIVIDNRQVIESILDKKDLDTLTSIFRNTTNFSYITDKQARLSLKLLQEISKKSSIFSNEITQALADPVWARDFRVIEQIKKFFIGKNSEQDLCLVLDFTHNSQIRKILQNLSKNLENLKPSINGKTWEADLTERNIVALVDALAPFGFDQDETIKNHYDTIKSWSEISVKNQFVIGNIENPNFLKHIISDLGEDAEVSNTIIADRSVRYQYLTKTAKNHGETLTEVIANRSKSRVWIDKKQHTFDQVIASLLDLQRLPLLVVFDTAVNNQYLENLKILSDALEKNGIVDGIGVYFRTDNGDTGKQFNTLIADKKYNQQLDTTSKVAVIQSGKIPKFFLKTAWRPMSVIALDSRMGLRHGKTSVYSNCCDLIIEWAEHEALIDKWPKIA